MVQYGSIAGDSVEASAGRPAVSEARRAQEKLAGAVRPRNALPPKASPGGAKDKMRPGRLLRPFGADGCWVHLSGA